jgi:hypothetical protein
MDAFGEMEVDETGVTDGFMHDPRSQFATVTLIIPSSSRRALLEDMLAPPRINHALHRQYGVRRNNHGQILGGPPQPVRSSILAFTRPSHSHAGRGRRRACPPSQPVSISPSSSQFHFPFQRRTIGSKCSTSNKNQCSWISRFRFVIIAIQVVGSLLSANQFLHSASSQRTIQAIENLMASGR